MLRTHLVGDGLVSCIIVIQHAIHLISTPSLSKPASLLIWSRHLVSVLARCQATVALARLLRSILAKVRLYRVVSDEDNLLRQFL